MDEDVSKEFGEFDEKVVVVCVRRIKCSKPWSACESVKKAEAPGVEGCTFVVFVNFIH